MKDNYLMTYLLRKSTGVKIDLIKRFQAIMTVEEQKDDDFSDDEEKEN